MEKKNIAKGAEADIYLEDNYIIKKRNSKTYRIKEIDKKIIKCRTKAEKKLLNKAGEVIFVPIPKETKEIDIIKMPYIEGKKLSTCLDSFDDEKQEKIMFELGQIIAKLHDRDIIHGDLTTSNMIYTPNNKICLIDFGLGYFNGKYEDKGVDIHLLKQALESKHYKNYETLFREFEVGYKSVNPSEAQKVFEKLKSIEKRGRYKE